ncbi:hypothetical protein OAS46_06470 [Alphaproteobacteria bacterium]|jgi:hypothetical protein|nr:hypothetical protein [Alphaproteobacteria bacterium]
MTNRKKQKRAKKRKDELERIFAKNNNPKSSEITILNMEEPSPTLYERFLKQALVTVFIVAGLLFIRTLFQ